MKERKQEHTLRVRESARDKLVGTVDYIYSSKSGTRSRYLPSLYVISLFL